MWFVSHSVGGSVHVNDMREFTAGASGDGANTARHHPTDRHGSAVGQG
jgi:hypothetical protein